MPQWQRAMVHGVLWGDPLWVFNHSTEKISAQWPKLLALGKTYVNLRSACEPECKCASGLWGLLQL